VFAELRRDLPYLALGMRKYLAIFLRFLDLVR